ncbi:MAG: hypothetical protein ACI4II_09595 [Acutalibacteraceae bacterium]
MKKFVSIILTLAMAASISACSGNAEKTSSVQSNSEAVSQQSSSDNGGENSSESVLTSINEDTIGQWNSEDFSKFAIIDIKEMNMGEMAYYNSSENEVTVKWKGITDFDAVKEYGESLFQTEYHHYYELGVNEETGEWIHNYDKTLETFDDACESWNSINDFSADWFYELGGKIVLVSYSGSKDTDDSTLITLKVSYEN